MLCKSLTIIDGGMSHYFNGDGIACVCSTVVVEWWGHFLGSGKRETGGGSDPDPENSELSGIPSADHYYGASPLGDSQR